MKTVQRTSTILVDREILCSEHTTESALCQLMSVVVDTLTDCGTTPAAKVGTYICVCERERD